MTDHEASQNSIPTLEAVTSAYGEVLTHNREHAGFGAGFANLFKAIIEAEEGASGSEAPAEDIYADIHDNMDKATIEGDMHGELQDILHEDTFMRIGINLAPLGSHLSELSGKRASSIELLPMVTNTELFTDFLSGLNPTEVQGDEKNLALMTDVVSTLRKTVALCYGKLPEGISDQDTQMVIGHGEDVLRSFLRIDEAYKKLGLDNPTLYQHYIEEGTSGYLDEQWQRHQKATKYFGDYKALENYVTYWGRGVLPEYLDIGSMEYLAQDKKYAFDGMSEHLVKQIDGIVGLTATERTREFGVEAAKAMLSGVEKTIHEMDENPDDWFASPSNREFLVGNAARLQAVINPAAETEN